MVLRICNVDEEGRFGGPERRIVQVAVALKSFGVDTHVIYPSMDSDAFSAYIRKNEVDATKIKITRLSKEPKVLARYILFFVVEIIRLSSFIKRNQFDLVHVNGSYQFKVAIAAKLAGTKVVWHLNDTMMSGLVKRVFSFVASRCASGFIVAGKRVHDYYLKGTPLAERPCLEIHAPVDTEVFSPERCSETLRDDVVKKTITIVTVSGLNPTKGLEYFVEMAIRLHALKSNVRFKVAGAELTSHREYAAKIKNMVSESVLPEGIIDFLGLVEDVPGLLCSADVCVFTSISEASPTSVWEALSMGKAVVTTDVGSVGQYIQDGYSGFIVPVRDVNGLVQRVASLVSDQKLRSNIGCAARQLAVESLDISQAARKHVDIYRQLLNEKL